jgi:2-phosphosulfolactate phosphatase
VVTIGCFHEHLPEHEAEAAIVAVDVLRATTTAVTAVASGRRCFAAASLEAAVPLAARLDDPLLVGELGGFMPYGFHVQNSPAQIERHDEVGRPMVLLSTSGTRLMCEAAATGQAAHAACLRNVTAQVEALAGRHRRVLLYGADSRGQFREEDQLACAWIATRLVDAGYATGDEPTRRVLERWAGASPDSIVDGPSARYLRETGQVEDLDFVLGHVDDLDATFPIVGTEITMRARA